MRFLAIISLFVFLLFPGCKMQEVDSVRASFNLTNSITIVNNNEKFVFQQQH